MKALLLLLPLLADGDAPAPPPEPFAATFARFRALVEEGRADEARALAEPLLSGDALAEGERAALAFGLGLAGARGEDPAAWPDAVQSFQSARALAGSGELRRRATYDAGVVDLQEGERRRAQIPEVAQRSGAGAPPALATPPALAPVPAPGATPAPGAPPEDPLPAARAAYERARATLCERLRSDWKDADTRANLELVQRRLHELDEIERQREEQEKQQEEQQQDQQQGQDQEPQDDSQGEDGDQEQKQQQADAKDAQRPDAGELQPPAEQGAPAEEQDPAQAGEPEDAERHLTREEVLRLLDRLAELEAQGKALEARLRQARRETVEKDW